MQPYGARIGRRRVGRRLRVLHLHVVTYGRRTGERVVRCAWQLSGSRGCDAVTVLTLVHVEGAFGERGF